MELANRRSNGMTEVKYEKVVGPQNTPDTLSERLEGLVVGDMVEIVQVSAMHREDMVGEVGELRMIDRDDTMSTFNVRFGTGQMVWVHRVRKTAEPAAPVDTSSDVLAATVASLKQAQQALMTERQVAAEFADQVREVAIRVADEQSWCTERLNDVLDELGLDARENPLYVFTVNVEYTVRGRRNDDGGEPSENHIENSLTGFDEMGMDGDWDDVSVSAETISVSGVQEDE